MASRICIPSICAILSSDCYYPSYSLSLSHATHLSVLDGARKELVSLTASCIAEKVKLFLLPSSIHSSQIFAPTVKGTFPLDYPQTSPKALLSVSDCLNQCFLDGRW